MGRGEGKQAADGQSLLFGPRHTNSNSAKAKASRKEMVASVKRKKRGQEKDAYAARFISAADSLSQGDTEPLAQIISEDIPTGYKGVYTKMFREMVEKISADMEVLSYTGYSHSSISPQVRSKILKRPEDLDTLVKLLEIMKENNLPTKCSHAMGRSIILAAQISANVDATDDLISLQDEIGEIPSLIIGGDHRFHIAKDDRPICGIEISTSFSKSKSSFETILECEQCILLKNQETDLIAAPQWTQDIQTIPLVTYGRFTSPYGWWGYQLPDNGQEIMDTYKKIVRTEINNNAKNCGISTDNILSL
jgi:hypothetical protein